MVLILGNHVAKEVIFVRHLLRNIILSLNGDDDGILRRRSTIIELFSPFFLDFELSDAQQGHAYAVERLTPRLAALRFELCPVHLSEGFFWMVYFVLLYSRLKKHDAELLSTPQVC